MWKYKKINKNINKYYYFTVLINAGKDRIDENLKITYE